MGHDHGHDHNHAHHANKKALILSFSITGLYMLIEAIGGFWTHSLALLSDAGHMLSDTISLGVGVLAFVIGGKMANFSKTYGYKRFEILAALFNGVTLIVVSLYIFYEAAKRLSAPPDVASTGMLIIAIIGFLVNLIVAFILMRGDTKENLNLRAAFLHVLGDLLGSVGAIIAAILIMLFNWEWADSVASVIVAILIIISGFRVTRDSIHVLMEGTPQNVNLNDIVQAIESISGVKSIHDLHVWSITSGENALSCHAVVADGLTISDSQTLLKTMKQTLKQMEINHVTVQLECADHPHEDSLLCHMDDTHTH